MLTRSVSLPATDGQPWRIYALSDAHIGSALCDEAALERYVATIAADPRGRAVITGDLIAAIGNGDKRMDFTSLAPWIRDADPAFAEDVLGLQCDRAVEMLRPIVDRIDAYVSGNHENKPRQWYGRALGVAIARALDCRDAYLGSQGWLCYSFKVTRTQRRRLSLYLHHGYSAGRAVGGQAAMLERMLRDHDCDVAICGHSHETFVRPMPRMRLDGKTGRAVQQMRWAIMAGTFEHSLDNGSDSWMDQQALSPKRVGGVVVEYNPATAGTGVSVAA